MARRQISIGEQLMEKEFNFRWLISILFGFLFTVTCLPIAVNLLAETYSTNIFQHRQYWTPFVALILLFCFCSVLVSSLILKKHRAQKLFIALSIINIFMTAKFTLPLFGLVFTVFLILLWINFIFLTLQHEWARKTASALLCILIGGIFLVLVGMVSSLQTTIYFFAVLKLLFYLLTFIVFSAALYFSISCSASEEHLTS